MDQPKNIKYVCSYSGGKDSTATIILAHEHNDPLDIIVFSEVMFDENTSGELPEHIDFIRNVAFPTFESWGYKCVIVHANKTFKDCFYHKVTNARKYVENEGKYKGFPIISMCDIQRDCKIKPIKRFDNELGDDTIHYLGIAIDEPKRLERLKENQISLMQKYNVTEEQALNMCIKYELLSPVYNISSRGGCWFCPNGINDTIKHVYRNHRNLFNELLLLEEEENVASNSSKWYNTPYGKKISLHDLQKTFELDENQLSLF